MRGVKSLGRDFEALSQLAFDLSQGWFRDPYGEDMFEHDRIQFGLVPQIDVFHIIRNAVDGHGLYGRYPYSFDRIVKLLKSKHLEWKLKANVSKLLGLCNIVERPLHGTQGLFIYDVWNAGSIKSLLEVQTALPAGFVTASVSFDPRVWKIVGKLKQSRHFLYPVGFGGKRTSVAEELKRSWLSKYDKNRGLLLNKLTEALAEDGEHLLREFDRFVPTFYTQLASDYQRAVWLLETIRPEVIVMATDCHKWSRLITLIAKRMKIRTLVVQHGVPVAKHAYVPVVADQMAVWGKTSVERLSQWGAPKEKLVITGQPRFDHLPSLREQRSGRSEESRKPLFVVATSPLTKALDRDFINVVSQGLSHFRDKIDVTLKLHPGDSREAFYRREVDSRNLDWDVVRYADTHQLLAKAAGVITTQSTVGIEALAIGTPLIVVEMPGIPQAVPYGKSNAALVVQTAKELQSAVGSILRGEPSLAQVQEAGTRLAEEYLHRLDGHATSRVISLITETPAKMELLYER